MELVTVISILGILAAMTVPKFFNLRFKAEIETENQIIGTIREMLEPLITLLSELLINTMATYNTEMIPMPANASRPIARVSDQSM